MSDNDSQGGDAIPLTLQEKFDQEWCIKLRTAEEFTERVLADEENLVVVFVIAPTLCPHSNAWLQGPSNKSGGLASSTSAAVDVTTPTILSISTPQAATIHARFFRIHAEDADVSLLESGSAPSTTFPTFDRTPAMLLYLKGKPFVEAPLVAGTAVAALGSNAPLMAAVFRNELIRRNDVMRDYDEAKAAALAEEAEEDEEGEEGEEAEEDE